MTGSAPVCAHIRPHISLRPTAGAPPLGSGFIEKKGLRDGLTGLGGSLGEQMWEWCGVREKRSTRRREGVLGGRGVTAASK